MNEQPKHYTLEEVKALFQQSESESATPKHYTIEEVKALYADQGQNTGAKKYDPNNATWPQDLAAFTDPAVDEMTFGLLKPAIAAGIAAASGGDDKRFSDRYWDAIDFLKGRESAIRAKHPYISGASALGGGFMQAGAIGAGLNAAPIKSPASLSGRLIAGGVGGGMLGAGNAALREGIRQALETRPGERSSKSVLDAAKEGFVWGSGLGLAGASLGHYLSRRIKPRKTPIVSDKADKVVDRGVKATKTHLGGKEGLQSTLDSLSETSPIGLGTGTETDALVRAAGPNYRVNTIEPEMAIHGGKVAKAIGVDAGKGVKTPFARAQEIERALSDKYASVGQRLDDATDMFAMGGNGISTKPTALSDSAKSVLENQVSAQLRKNPSLPTLAFDEARGEISPHMAELVYNELAGDTVNPALAQNAKAIRGYLRKELNKIAPGYSDMLDDFSKLHRYTEGAKNFRPGTTRANKVAMSNLSGMERLGAKDALLSHKYNLGHPTGNTIRAGSNPLVDATHVASGLPYGLAGAESRGANLLARPMNREADKKLQEAISQVLRMNKKKLAPYLAPVDPFYPRGLPNLGSFLPNEKRRNR